MPLDIQYLLHYSPASYSSEGKEGTNINSNTKSTVAPAAAATPGTNTAAASKPSASSSTSINTTKATSVFSRMIGDGASNSSSSGGGSGRSRKPQCKHVKGIYNTFPVDIHTLVSLVTVSPHIALIVDAPVTLKPGRHISHFTNIYV